MIKYKQVLTLNNDGNHEYISTGATYNSQEYITLPTILGMYNTTDPTLRKYLRKNGYFGKDYFLSDGRMYILIDFLTSNHFYLKNEKASTYHPYRKTRLVGSKIPYNLLLNSYKSNDKLHDESVVTKKELIKNLKEYNWDYYITINLRKFTPPDMWDLYAFNFIDEFSNLLSSRNVHAAYSKEYSIRDNKLKSKYDQEHCHIHMLLSRDSKSIKIQTIKGLFLSAIGQKSFKKGEFDIKVYNSNDNAIEYILKDFDVKDSNFVLIHPKY
jgi:hypothetical protein